MLYSIPTFPASAKNAKKNRLFVFLKIGFVMCTSAPVSVSATLASINFFKCVFVLSAMSIRWITGMGVL